MARQNIIIFSKTKACVFWHMAEVSARSSMENYHKKIAHLFHAHWNHTKTMKNPTNWEWQNVRPPNVSQRVPVGSIAPDIAMPQRSCGIRVPTAHPRSSVKVLQKPRKYQCLSVPAAWAFLRRTPVSVPAASAFLRCTPALSFAFALVLASSAMSETEK